MYGAAVLCARVVYPGPRDACYSQACELCAFSRCPRLSRDVYHVTAGGFQTPMEAIRNVDAQAIFNLERLSSRGQGIDPITSKPWVSTSYPPSEPPPLNLTATSECLQLEWVFGYHSQDSRNNIMYNGRVEIMWPAANIVVLMKQQESGARLQRFYREHTDNVSCLRMHQNGKICVSGQVQWVLPSLLCTLCRGLWISLHSWMCVAAIPC